VNKFLKLALVSVLFVCSSWGFFVHKLANKLAVFTLPPEMIGFYKANIMYIFENAPNPDVRRYAVPEEAPRHFIDIEDYGDSARTTIPKYWNDALKKYGNDTLNKRGIVPWYIVTKYNYLKEAFLLRDPQKILLNSAELGHYVADAHVPLHSTNNHNGQLTNQVGIHAFWESRLPELFSSRYDAYVGKASYIADIQQATWDAVWESHRLVDSVLMLEKIVASRLPSKYGFDNKGKATVKTFSYKFSNEYHTLLRGMVERRFRASIKMIADIWFTAWVDAGQPDLKSLINYKPTTEELENRKAELKKWKEGKLTVRTHETDTVQN